MIPKTTIRVHNGAWYRKVAPVEISLAKLKAKLKGLSIDRLEIKKDGKIIPFQIDRLDQNDSLKDVLVFMADVPGYSSTDYYLHEADLKQEVDKNIAVKVLPKQKEKWDFELKNNSIEVKFHRGRTPMGDCAGSAYYVKIEGGAELTNPFGVIMPEGYKRVMWLDRIWVAKPWNPPISRQDWYQPVYEWYVGNKDYEYVNSGEGPVRGFLTLRAPLQYENSYKLEIENPIHSGPGKALTSYDCYLYRILTLYSDKYYVHEEIYVEAKKFRIKINGEEIKSGEISIPIAFSSRFKTFVPGLYGYGPDFRQIWKKDIIPDWFAFGNNSFPHPRIGFASNVHVENYFFDPISNYGQWDLSPSWHVRCIHQFMEGKNVPPKDRQEYNFEHVAGSNWYDAIYTPLWGEIV